MGSEIVLKVTGYAVSTLDMIGELASMAEEAGEEIAPALRLIEKSYGSLGGEGRLAFDATDVDLIVAGLNDLSDSEDGQAESIGGEGARMARAASQGLSTLAMKAREAARKATPAMSEVSAESVKFTTLRRGIRVSVMYDGRAVTLRLAMESTGRVLANIPVKGLGETPRVVKVALDVIERMAGPQPASEAPAPPSVPAEAPPVPVGAAPAMGSGPDRSTALLERLRAGLQRLAEAS